MTMQELEITISPQGEVRIQVKGAQGDACLDLTKGLEAGLGSVMERQFTSEYYEARSQQAQQWNHGGA